MKMMVLPCEQTWINDNKWSGTELVDEPVTWVFTFKIWNIHMKHSAYRGSFHYWFLIIKRVRSFLARPLDRFMFAQTDPNYKTKHKHNYCNISYFQRQFNSTYIIWWILSHRKCQWGPCQFTLSRRTNGAVAGNGSCVHCTFRSSSLFDYPTRWLQAVHHGWSSWSRSSVSVLNFGRLPSGND